MSRIQQFYVGQNIFITGGTGFLGKILTEKLLRSCPEIGTIYFLVRAKKGKTAEERINALLLDPIFDVLRSSYPNFSNKIVGVTGNIAQDDLGLSTTDRARLVNEVSVIFHLAAAVRFDEKLDTAVAINVNSVKFIVDIAKACKNLKAGIYVSTAYSNGVRMSIDEKLYPPPFSCEEVNKLIEDVGKEKLSEDNMQYFTKTVLGDWPNTYSFTKAIAEGVVAEFAKEIPFAIFRPSIVMSTYREPIPGWSTGTLGLSGMICAAYLGILHTTLLDSDLKVDIVPVDYACNALISSAWETGVTKRRHHEEIPVYNYVSGNENPVTWKHFCDKVPCFGNLYPTTSAIYYSHVISTKSKWLHSILELFLHFIPALIIDSIARLLGKSPGLYKVASKIRASTQALKYFSTKEWSFNNQRVQNLWKRMGPMDRQTFPFNMQDVDWDEHAMKMIRGVRKYIIGDPDSNLEQTRRRHFRLYIVHTVVRLTLGLLVIWMIWKLFCGRSLTICTQTFVP